MRLISWVSAALVCLGNSGNVSAQDVMRNLGVEPVSLPADLGNVANLGRLEFRGGLEMTRDADDFYGWSGIWVSEDGSELVGVELGSWVRARLTYDDEGNLSGFIPLEEGSLHDPSGQPLTEGDDSDAEGLDFNGTDFIVGFETNDRVMLYRDIDGPGVEVPIPQSIVAPIFRGTGFSSVTALADGSLVTIPEYAYANVEDKANGAPFTSIPTRGWMEGPHGAGPVYLRANLPWLPVSLVTLPDGDLLTVEVHLQEDRSIDYADIGIVPAEQAVIGGTLRPETIATLAAPLPQWRIEGGAARTGANGETLIYLLSTSSPPVLYMFELAEER